MDIKFCEILESRLEGENLSALARQLGIPRTLIFEWTKTKRLPSMKNIKYIKRLADHLGLSLESLLLGEEPKRKTITSLEFLDGDRKYSIAITRVKD